MGDTETPESPITLAMPIQPAEAIPKQPRARDAVSVSVKRLGATTALDGLRMSGSLKCLFPRRCDHAVEAVLVNSAGGTTGGDRIEIDAHAAERTVLTLTTQTAERAYRAQPGETGCLATKLRVDRDAALHWLPQETILFDGTSLNRSLQIDLESNARLLLVEPMIFGRVAMGEIVREARFHDSIDIWRDHRPLFVDRTRLIGDIAAHLDRPHVANGARAMALMVYVSKDAEARLAGLRAMLPSTAGASLIGADLLVARCLAPDGFTLRQTLLPVLEFLSASELPRCWIL